MIITIIIFVIKFVVVFSISSSSSSSSSSSGTFIDFQYSVVQWSKISIDHSVCNSVFVYSFQGNNVNTKHSSEFPSVSDNKDYKRGLKSVKDSSRWGH